MKYLALPKKIFLFWYPDSLLVLLRSWRNSIFWLEEDLAVGLMARFLFVPLFHDATLMGRLLSFFFRCFRILIGLFAYLLVTLTILLIALVWFLLPLLVFLLTGTLGWVGKGLLASGLVYFIHHIIVNPPKKIWQIKIAQNIWQCSFIKEKNASLPKLLVNYEVKNLLKYLEQTPQEFSNLFSSKTPEPFLEKAWNLGKELKIPFLGPEHFFVSLLLSLPNIENDLLKINLTPQDLIDTLKFLQLKKNLWRRFLIFDEDFRVHHLKGVNRGWLGFPTPNLDLVTEDLTKKALRVNTPDFIGRSEMVTQIINILSTEKGRNVLILGDAGMGKTALVEYLAKWIVSGDAPEALANKRLVRLDLTKLLADVKTQGDLAAKIDKVFEEVKSHGNIIIFVDEIQNLGLGEVGSSFNLYSLLLPYLESFDFQFIGATERENYTRIIERNSSLVRLFAKVELTSASFTETLEILERRSIEAEKYQKIQTSFPALKTMATLAPEYFKDRVLPDSALFIFNECLSKASNGWVFKKTAEEFIQSQSPVPVTENKSEQKQQLLNLETIIHQKFIDQEEAVSSVAQTLRRSAVHLREKNRPIGSFLFVGPTGVGKTQLAKILSQVYFQGKGKFLRFDMSEYQTSDAVASLIGTAQAGGHLTEEVHSNPYSLILLDEFEKADSKVLTLFLQVLDDGRLTDGTGKLIDFTNTIIIATSNAGSLLIAQGLTIGQNLKVIETSVKEELLKVFKPELINRFDGIVLFKPLSVENLQKIVRIKLLDLQKMLKDQGYLVEFEDDLVKELAKKGFDNVLGARPLRRLIQDTLEARLSVMILENKLPKGQPFQVTANLLSE